MILGVAQRNVGRVARTNLFEVSFRMGYWAPHVRSADSLAAALPWDDSNVRHSLALDDYVVR